MTPKMTDLTGAFAPQLQSAVGVWIERLARWLALAGGVMLIFLTGMTIVSVIGRSLTHYGYGPVEGDFEIVEIGTAFAVFSFLPWCQFNRGHVTVDVLIQRFGPKALAGLAFVGNIVLTVVSAVILWRLTLGLSEKLAYQETTLILQFPVWWGYAAASLGAALFVLVAAFTAWRSANEMTGSGEHAAASDVRQGLIS